MPDMASHAACDLGHNVMLLDFGSFRVRPTAGVETIRALGGMGYIDESPTGRPQRDAKHHETGAGASEIRRWLVGRDLFIETGCGLGQGEIEARVSAPTPARLCARS